MSFTGDRSELGVWALRDEREIEPHKRLYLAGFRVIPDDEDWAGFTFAEQSGKGTAGDIHPWAFFQGGERKIGSWQSMFGSEIVGSGGSGQFQGGGAFAPGDHGPAYVRQSDGSYKQVSRSTTASGGGSSEIRAQPIRKKDYRADSRYMAWEEKQPSHLPTYPEGYRVVATSGTEEQSHEGLILPADGRIVVPQAFGPDRMGTTYCDMVDPGVLGREGPYGVGGRDAPGQTLHWVVRFKEYGPLLNNMGNGLAMNATLTNQGRMAGFAPFVARTVFGESGPAQGGDPEPDDPVVTPSGGSEGNPEGADHPVFRGFADTTGGGGGSGDATPGGSVAPGARTKKAPAGQMTTVAFQGVEAAGPWHPGFFNDKHQHGKTRDGQPCNAGHLGFNAYWAMSEELDGPKEFTANVYSQPKKIGYPWVTELNWDKFKLHPFMDGAAPGMWRRETFVPIIPGDGDDDDPPGDEPPGDTPSTPGEPPTTPPTTPPPGPPPNTPTTPSTPDFGTPGDGSQGGDGGGTWYPGPFVPGVQNGGGGVQAAYGISQYDHGSGKRETVMNLPMVMGVSETVYRAQGIVEGMADLRFKTAPVDVAKSLLASAPVVYRDITVGSHHDSGEWNYQTYPDRSRVPGGISSGGRWSVPAAFDGADYRTTTQPSVDVPDSYRGFATGVYVAFGKPSTSQGVQDNGVRIGWDDTALRMKIEGIASSTWTEAIGVTGGGDIGFFGQTPSSQPSLLPVATEVHSLAGGDTIDQAGLEAALNAFGIAINTLNTGMKDLGLRASS